MAYPPPIGGYGYPPVGGAHLPAGGAAYPPGIGGGYPAGYPSDPGYPPVYAGYAPPPGYVPPGQPPVPVYGFNTGYPQGYDQPPAPGYGQPLAPGHGQHHAPGHGQHHMPGHGQPHAPGYGQAPSPQPGYGQAPSPQPGYNQNSPQHGYSQQSSHSGYGQQAPPNPQAPVPAVAPAMPHATAPCTAPVASPLITQMANLHVWHGTVKPISPFDAEADCELLRKAMRGVGTDEAQLINILASRSNAQRVEIRLRYKTMFGKDLMDDLKSELSGNLEECLLAMMEPAVLYDAKCLRRAMRGAGTDEETLIDILCSRDNTQIRAIKEQYKNHYQRDLEKDCVSETSGHFKRLLVSMCQANRDESGTVDIEKAKKEANDLLQAGEKKWGTDESRFNVILASRNFNQLQATFNEYVKISQRDIINSIDREMSGDLKAGFKCIVQCARNPAEYFADRLWTSMKGVGTDDSLLIRIVVSRSEYDLANIKTEFLRKYHKTLYKMIEGDCSGDYKKLLLALVKSDI